MVFIPEKIIRSFVYVDCGARGEENHPFLSAYPGAQYIGFEADAEESSRVQAKVGGNRKIFPVAVGDTNTSLPFYLTQNPACSSFLEPDPSFFNQFMGTTGDIDIRSVVELPVVPLDDYLPKAEIHSIDFIELDTQGNELDILNGAGTFLKNSVLGLRVEVEFSPIYKKQPLFSDVDAFVRSQGFMLFDLSRHRYRRAAAPLEITTKGQVLYGHAFYLKDYRRFTGTESWLHKVKLVMIADFFGFRDYAYEIVKDFVMSQPKHPEIDLFSKILADYENLDVKRTRMTSIIQFADRLRMRKLLERLVRFCSKIAHEYRFETSPTRPFWTD